MVTESSIATFSYGSVLLVLPVRLSVLLKTGRGPLEFPLGFPYKLRGRFGRPVTLTSASAVGGFQASLCVSLKKSVTAALASFQRLMDSDNCRRQVIGLWH